MWLPSLVAAAAVSTAVGAIDRRSVVQRHLVNLTGVGQPGIASLKDAPLTLTVGNGVIGFNADATGFQSMNTTYSIFPLTTLSDWGWHSEPPPGPSDEFFAGFQYDQFNVSSGRDVPYPLSVGGHSWLRENPHRLDLIQVALRRASKPRTPLVSADLARATQTLDPWTGALRSSFSVGDLHAVNNAPVETKTACHMDLDVLSWKVEAAQLAPTSASDPDALALRIAFPYGSGCSNCAGSDWSKDDAHTTVITASTPTTVRLARKLDHDAYEVLCRWSAGAVLTRDGPHAFLLALKRRETPAAEASAPTIELSCLLSPGTGARYPVDADSDWLTKKAAETRAMLTGAAPLPLYDEVAAAAASSWQTFWESGAFVDLAGADGTHKDPRAFELERRVVLSQYLTRSQSAGSTPPQETGYTLNSWYGKHHHEMRWWHQTHFALWQRPSLLQRSDGWFRAMLANATAYAANQGYEGARWPKMVGPANTAQQLPPGADWRTGAFVAQSVGKTTYSNSTWPLLYWTGPSGTGPMLIWQQPHIIWMTELQRLHADTPAAAAAIVASMADVVTATADFMASYAAPIPKGRPAGKKVGELWLGPPTDGGEEGNLMTETWNPTFELTYFRLGLKIATEWRERAGLPAKASWARTLSSLAEPTVLPTSDGADAYAINANCWGFPQRDLNMSGHGKHRCSGAYTSHPLFLGAFGMINGAAVTPPIDPEIMNTTLALTIEGWDWPNTWGWDYPLWAFAQMRLGWSPSSVVDMLLRNETKNLYFANGHDFETPALPCYLPGNGGLLSAVAMMAGGFTDGAGKAVVAVGFPPEWGAVAEGFKAYPLRKPILSLLTTTQAVH